MHRTRGDHFILALASSYTTDSRGMVATRFCLRQSSCRNEDGGEAPWRKTQVETEGHRQKRHESLEDQGGMSHWQGTMERLRQDPLPRTTRGRRKLRKTHYPGWCIRTSNRHVRPRTVVEVFVLVAPQRVHDLSDQMKQVWIVVSRLVQVAAHHVVPPRQLKHHTTNVTHLTVRRISTSVRTYVIHQLGLDPCPII